MFAPVYCPNPPRPIDGDDVPHSPSSDSSDSTWFSDAIAYDKFAVDPSHPKAIEFARQCFRIRIIVLEDAETTEDFLMGPVNEDRLIREVNELMQFFAFNFDYDIGSHIKWALLAEETDFWGSDKMEYWDEQRELFAVINDLKEFAIRRAMHEIEELEGEMLARGKIGPEWNSLWGPLGTFAHRNVSCGKTISPQKPPRGIPH